MASAVTDDLERLHQLPPTLPVAVRSGPPPLHGGPLTLLRFARASHMLSFGYLVLIARWLWLKLRWRGRLEERTALAEVGE